MFTCSLCVKKINEINFRPIRGPGDETIGRAEIGTPSMIIALVVSKFIVPSYSLRTKCQVDQVNSFHRCRVT